MTIVGFTYPVPEDKLTTSITVAAIVCVPPDAIDISTLHTINSALVFLFSAPFCIVLIAVTSLCNVVILDVCVVIVVFVEGAKSTVSTYGRHSFPSPLLVT